MASHPPFRLRSGCINALSGACCYCIQCSRAACAHFARGCTDPPTHSISATLSITWMIHNFSTPEGLGCLYPCCFVDRDVTTRRSQGLVNLVSIPILRPCRLFLTLPSSPQPCPAGFCSILVVSQARLHQYPANLPGLTPPSRRELQNLASSLPVLMALPFRESTTLFGHPWKLHIA